MRIALDCERSASGAARAEALVERFFSSTRMTAEVDLDRVPAIAPAGSKGER
jgi:hypothetical protein